MEIVCTFGCLRDVASVIRNWKFGEKFQSSRFGILQGSISHFLDMVHFGERKDFNNFGEFSTGKREVDAILHSLMWSKCPPSKRGKRI